jgi:hypothetical protein
MKLMKNLNKVISILLLVLLILPILSYPTLVIAEDLNFSWAKSLGGVLNDRGYSLSVDSLGNVHTVGFFRDTVDFDPGVGVFELTSVGDSDVFISKLDSNGDFLWAKSVGGASSDVVNSVDTDLLGNVYITGYFRNTADFNPGEETYSLISLGGQDVFIVKFAGTDITPPVITEIIPVPSVVVNNASISYTFNTNEAGTITYGGSCSSATTVATLGSNTITFTPLSPGTYSNCTITVTDVFDNISIALSVSPFTTVIHSGGGEGSIPSMPAEETTPTTPTDKTKETTTTITNTEIINTDNEINNCTADKLLTQDVKIGAIDGIFNKYTKAIVKEVKVLQSHLNRLGFKSGKVDGIIGPITDGAIKRIQKYFNISQDGVVGPVTRAVINENCDID